MRITSLISIVSFVHVLFAAHEPLNDSVHTCTKPWPPLELWLPLGLRIAGGKYNKGTRRRNNEFGYWFFRSFFLFWPIEISKVRLRLILDEEIGPTMPKGNMTVLYHDAMSLMQSYVNKRKKYVPSFNFSSLLNITYGPISPHYKTGYDRQQWMMFWADNYSTSEYIGFVDSDTLFTTYVDVEDLFEHGKPVVNGRLDFVNKKGDAWAIVPTSTNNFTGLLEPLRCMAYFPVIIKRAHLPLIRDHISSIHNQSFNQIYAKLSRLAFYSQFNIMCAYLYHYQRDEYVWYLHDVHPQHWNTTSEGVVERPPGTINPGQVSLRSVYLPHMFLPKPRVALHARYHYYNEVKNTPDMVSWLHQTDLLDDVLRRGYCDSPPFDTPTPIVGTPINGTFSATEMTTIATMMALKNLSVCASYQYNITYNPIYYKFEYVDWNEIYNHSDLLRLHWERRTRLQSCSHLWPHPADEGALRPP